MVQGGAILFGSPYTLRTVASFQEAGKEEDVADYLTATRINNTPSESIGNAVILTTDGGKFTDLSSVDIDKVVGVSWYAAAKIMEEVIQDPSKQNALTSILFTVGAPDDTKIPNIPNNAKKALIAFIHGVHAYGIVSDGIVGSTGGAAKSMGFKEKYDAVVEYIKKVQEDTSKGTERGHIQGIWNALMEQYALETADNVVDIINSLEYKNIERFLQTPAASAPPDKQEPEDPVADAQTPQPKDPLTIIFETPTKFPIHDVLGKTK